MKTNKAALHSSFVIVLHVEKAKKPYTIGEILLKPCIGWCENDAWEKSSQTMKQIPLSNDTIKSRINEMSDNIQSKVIPLLFLLPNWKKVLMSPISHRVWSIAGMLQKYTGMQKKQLFFKFWLIFLTRLGWNGVSLWCCRDWFPC